MGHAKAHTSPSSSPSAPSATPSSPTPSGFGRTHLVTTRRPCSSRRRRRRAEGQRTTMIRGKLFLLLLVTGLAVAVHADEQSLKNRKLMTEEPIPVGSHAVQATLNLPFDENFDSASFKANFRFQLALLLDVPVDNVRTTAQATEVSAFFDDNVQFTLYGF